MQPWRTPSLRNPRAKEECARLWSTHGPSDGAETAKYGAQTQDAVLAVDQCFVEAVPRSGPMVGVVHAPYRTGDELRQVAKKSSDSVLFSGAPSPGAPDSWQAIGFVIKRRPETSL